MYEGKKDIKTGKIITDGVYFSNIVEVAEEYCSDITIPVKLIIFTLKIGWF